MGASALLVHGLPAPEPAQTMVEADPAGSASAAAAGSPETAVEPGGADVAVEAAGLPRLSLRLDVDIEARQVTVAVAEDESAAAKFVHEDGSWRLA